MATTLDSPRGWGMSSQGPHKREARGSESEMEEAAVLAVRMEEGAMSQRCDAPKICKRPETILSRACGRTSPAHTWI